MWEPMKPAPPPTQTLAPLPAGRVQDFISDMVGFGCVVLERGAGRFRCE